MPMPRYALGGFESEVNQFVSRSQETRLENQIEEARKEIENEWTPVIEQKVEEMGYDIEEFNGFHIGEDPAKLNLVEANQEDEGDNIPDGNNSSEENVGEGGTDFERPPASTEEDRIDEENQILERLGKLERKIEEEE
jgi:tetrahydromethanopterin S-methyltransferase subunit G